MTRAAEHPAKLDLGATLNEAVRLLPDMLRGAGGALGLSAIAVIATGFVTGWLATLAGAIAMVAGVSAFGAITRIGVAGDLAGAKTQGLGPLGFQLRKVEARLLGASLLCSLFMTIILSLLALTALALFGGAGLNAQAVEARDWAAVGPTWKLALLAFVGAVVLLTPVVLGLRLSLFAQATVGRGQMISLTATALTNGVMIPLFVGLLVVQIPALIWCGLIASGVLSGQAALWFGVIGLAAVQTPLLSGFLGSAYRRLETQRSLGGVL